MFINPRHGQRRLLPSIVALILSLAAGVVAFVPFAFHTSPLDAVMFRVPGIRVPGGMHLSVRHGSGLTV